MYFHILLLIIAAALTQLITAQSNETRIVGGVISSSYIKYQIALYINNNFACGGSLITDTCVLTAAHCAHGTAASAFKIRAGIKQLSKTGGVVAKVSKAFVPDRYNPNTVHFDVAILKLNKKVNGPNISTIKLNTNNAVKAGEKLKVSGWGLTSESGTSVSDHLRYVFVPAVSRKKCQSDYSGGITRTMFCAGVASGGKDSCSGDSGGPVVRNGKQYGIVSWGNGCARANYPGVYTSVRAVSPWIKKIKAAHC